MSFDKKKYKIDGQPASANDIIDMAKEMDPNFGADGIMSTSRAAAILREYGHEVR